MRRTLLKIRRTVGTPPMEIATLSQRSNRQEAKFFTITNLPLREQILLFLAIENSTSGISFNQPSLSSTMTRICTIQLATMTLSTRSWTRNMISRNMACWELQTISIKSTVCVSKNMVYTEAARALQIRIITIETSKRLSAWIFNLDSKRVMMIPFSLNRTIKVALIPWSMTAMVRLD